MEVTPEIIIGIIEIILGLAALIIGSKVIHKIVTKQKQKVGKNSTAIQSGRDTNIE